MTRPYKVFRVIGAAGISGLMALCVAFLMDVPAYSGINRGPSDDACVAAAKYVFRSEGKRPSNSFADFERDNPLYCENALVVPDSNGVWRGDLFEQIIHGAVWVRIQFGP